MQFFFAAMQGKFVMHKNLGAHLIFTFDVPCQRLHSVQIPAAAGGDGDGGGAEDGGAGEVEMQTQQRSTTNNSTLTVMF